MTQVLNRRAVTKYRLAPTGSYTSLRHPFLKHLVLIAICIVMMYPLLWMLAASFRPDADINNYSLWPGKDFTLHNYAIGWQGLAGTGFGHFFLNSLVIAVAAVVGNVISCSLAAYAFARVNFVLRRVWFALMLGTLMIPYHAILIPQYLLFRQFGWLNTPLPLIVPKFLAVDAFFIFLLTQFIRNLPRELDDAARIDGCGHFRIYLRVVLPLLRPALATTAVLTFIYSWNDFFSPLVYLTQTNSYTIPVALQALGDTSAQFSVGALFAMSLVALAPLFVLFISFQRLLISGIATTGLKG
jgi:multiple sugar transport system permease protein